MYKLNYLNKFGDAFFYQLLTFPQFRTRLQALKSDENIIAIGVSDLGKPIGLIMAEVSPDTNYAEILSIFVLSAYRRQKIATILLTKLEEELCKRGCIQAKLFCKTSKSKNLALKYLLQKCDWSPFKTWDIECKSDLDTIAQASWLHKNFRLPSDMEIFPWAEITYKENLVIRQTHEFKPWFGDGFDPFKNEKNFEPLNSLGLRYKGLIVGWILTERNVPDTIDYRCMFVRQDLQKLGRGIALFVNSIQLQNQAKIPKGIWRVNLDNLPMLRFVKKHMMPYLTSFEEVSYSFKSLTND